MSLRHPNEIECARQARRSLTLVRQKLLNPTPQALESCAPHLRTAIDSLARLQSQLGNAESRRPGLPTRELRTELSTLRRELAQVNALMQNAGAFHAALAHLLTPQADDSIRYAAGGIVPARPESTLHLEG
jgi:hypothetical protein